MKVFNKFVYDTVKSPVNTNDIWFDGSVFRIYKEGNWIPITLTKEATERLIEYANNLYVYVIVDELPESGEEDKIYIRRSDTGESSVILEEYIWDNGWKFVDNFNSVTSVTPDWNAQVDEPGYIGNRTHYTQEIPISTSISTYIEDFPKYYNDGTEKYYSKQDVNILYTEEGDDYLLTIPANTLLGYEYKTDVVNIEIDDGEIFKFESYSDTGDIFIKVTKPNAGNNFRVVLYKQLDERFIPNTIARKSDLSTKQDKLVSGVNISTINGKSLLKGGDIMIDSCYMITTNVEINKEFEIKNVDFTNYDKVRLNWNYVLNWFDYGFGDETFVYVGTSQDYGEYYITRYYSSPKYTLTAQYTSEIYAHRGATIKITKK